MTRRHLLGASALATLLRGSGEAGANAPHFGPHFTARAKRIIYLFQSGGPSQIDLFDYKPRLVEFQGTDLPESIRKGQR